MLQAKAAAHAVLPVVKALAVFKYNGCKLADRRTSAAEFAFCCLAESDRIAGFRRHAQRGMILLQLKMSPQSSAIVFVATADDTGGTPGSHFEKCLCNIAHLAESSYQIECLSLGNPPGIIFFTATIDPKLSGLFSHADAGIYPIRITVQRLFARTIHNGYIFWILQQYFVGIFKGNNSLIALRNGADILLQFENLRHIRTRQYFCMVAVNGHP